MVQQSGHNSLMQPTLGKRERNKQANRAAILDAARRVFAEYGFESVTIRDVIRATHLASGTFYNYFPDKEALFRALVGDRMHELTERLSYVRRGAESVEQFLQGAYETVYEEVCANPEFYRMMFRNEPIVRALYDDNVFGSTMHALRIDLADAEARGVFPSTNVDYLTAIFFGAAYEMARQLLQQEHPDPKAAAEFTTRLFLSGVAGLPDASAPLIRRGPLKLNEAAR